jgi:hypothetical protein
VLVSAGTGYIENSVTTFFGRPLFFKITFPFSSYYFGILLLGGFLACFTLEWLSFLGSISIKSFYLHPTKLCSNFLTSSISFAILGNSLKNFKKLIL